MHVAPSTPGPAPSPGLGRRRILGLPAGRDARNSERSPDARRAGGGRRLAVSVPGPCGCGRGRTVAAPRLLRRSADGCGTACLPIVALPPMVAGDLRALEC